MKYLNLDLSDLRSMDVLGEAPQERATWLMLMAYCADQENGGTIRDCAGWKDRKWQQGVKVTLAEVQSESALWEWSGDDLIVHLYPVEHEAKAKAIAERNKANGKKGGRPKGTQKEPSGFPDGTQMGTIKEGKGRKEKGREGEAPQPPLDSIREAGGAFVDDDAGQWLSLIHSHGLATVRVAIDAIVADSQTPRARLVTERIVDIRDDLDRQRLKEREHHERAINKARCVELWGPVQQLANAGYEWTGAEFPLKHAIRSGTADRQEIESVEAILERERDLLEKGLTP